jgi:RHS repeat-associated protein
VDQLFARIGSDGSAYWTLTDRLGSVRNVLDGSGNVKDTVRYDGFGNVISESGSTYRGRYAWTGRDRDAETGYQYNHRRWYDPTTARWLAQDPLGFDAGDSNLYRYVRNTPTMFLDPNGLIPIPGINVNLTPIGRGMSGEFGVGLILRLSEKSDKRDGGWYLIKSNWTVWCDPGITDATTGKLIPDWNKGDGVFAGVKHNFWQATRQPPGKNFLTPFNPGPRMKALGINVADYSVHFADSPPKNSKGAVRIYFDLYYVDGLKVFPKVGWQKWEAPAMPKVGNPNVLTNFDTTWDPQNLVTMDPKDSGVAWPALATITFGGTLHIDVSWTPGVKTDVQLSPP